jgi:sialate O-acetylesterase
MKSFTKALFLFFLPLSFLLPTHAAIRLPSIIGSHMVLQQNSKVLLWGWCNPGEKIKVYTDWSSQVDSTQGLNTAKWSLSIQTPIGGGPHKIILSTKGQDSPDAVVLEDVLIGEVWVCSGQSNMEMSADWNSMVLKDVPNANYPNIHLFTIPRTTSDYPQENCSGTWVVCTPETMKHFSAAGYYFGKRISTQLNIPVGLISSNWGGTPAEVWTPKDEVLGRENLKQASLKLTNSNGWPRSPGILYNAMIYPIIQYKIAGTIWYQGESNVGTNSTYTELFTLMIQDWRKAWGYDFPFYYVQIAPFSGYSGFDGALLRESQTQALSLPGTGMVVVSDLVDNIKDIHPLNKQDVGLRLANLALVNTYGEKGIACLSPVFDSYIIKGKSIELSFKNAENGLVARGGDPNEFMIAGDDGKYYPAKAKIVKNKVIVSSPLVPTPKSVQFGFTNSSMPNLFSKEGLPVNLFRTDKGNK